MTIMVDVRRFDDETVGTTILEITCGSDIPDDVFTRFVRAKVGLGMLLPPASILEPPSAARHAASTLRWRLKTADCAVHLALVRSTLELMGLPYCDAQAGDANTFESPTQGGEEK